MHIISTEVDDIGRFIRARREQSLAEEFSQIPKRRRHVEHLTQGDLAELIDVSTVVISQIEQGRYRNLSASMLRRIAHALKFTEQQSIYVLGMFDERPTIQMSYEPAPGWVQVSINQIAHPVLVTNPAYDIVVMNKLAKSLFQGSFENFTQEQNITTPLFREAAVREFIPDWEMFVSSVVSGIKMNYASMPAWRDYIDTLADELATQDDYFRTLWNQDDPLTKPTIEKVFHHTSLGEIRVKQILTDMIEVPWLTRIDFTPSDDSSRQKIARM